MERYINNNSCPITPDMTVLDVVSRYRQTEKIFKRYDKRVGACICCEALFEPLKELPKKFNLDLDKLIHELNLVVEETVSSIQKNKGSFKFGVRS